MAGTPKSLPVSVAVADPSGPVTEPPRGIVTGPIVQDTPKSGAVLPPTTASRATASPFWDDPQLKVPLMGPGLATNPTTGDIPGTGVSATDRGPNIWPSGGTSMSPVTTQGGVPLTTVTIPQNLASMLETVQDPVVSAPLVTVPTSPNS